MTPGLAGFTASRAIGGEPGGVTDATVTHASAADATVTDGGAADGGAADGSAADGSAPAVWDDIVAAVTTALGCEFTVVPDRTAFMAAERRTWFDTFDWRLFKAGIYLEYVPGRRGSELRLTYAPDSAASKTGASKTGAPDSRASDSRASDSGTPGTRGPDVLVQPVTGWQSSRSHLAGDIPPGAIADRVGRLIAPRALLPVATVTESAVVRRLLNGDAKTVARLVIERPVLSASGERRPVAPRFTIQPVRGYLGQARRAARVLEETEGIAGASGTLLEDALAALGRRPGDYSNKVNAPITAAMPASQAVARVLLTLLDAMEVNVPGVINDIDTEFLHDFRVAVRRTRAAIKLFGQALPARAAGTEAVSPEAVSPEEAAAGFRWLGDLTTPTRDLDVHLLGFDDMAARLRAAKPDDLEPFRSYLKERRAREFRALVRGLRSPAYRDLTQRWREALTPVGEKGARGRGASSRSGEVPAATLAAEHTRRAFAKVAKRGEAITPDSPHESLHDLRKRCKELRYALEFFAPVHDPATYAAVVGDLKKLQDCLGDFQDSEVQIAEIRSLATAMHLAGEAPAVTLLAMGELTAGLAATQAAARADFERRFAAFAGIDGQRRMSVLLRGGAV